MTRKHIWKLNVQGVILDVPTPTIVVREALTLAGFNPDQGWQIFLKVHGEPKRAVTLTDTIDLRTPGIEKLRLTPKEVNNGEAPCAPRRDFDLLDADDAHLDRLGLHWETVEEANRRWLVIHDYPMPGGYTVGETLLALEIPPTYPGAQIYGFYAYPPLALSSGRAIDNTQLRGIHSRARVSWVVAQSRFDAVESGARPRGDPARAGRRGACQGGRRMRPASTLAFAGITHDQVKHHLFPGDGLEAAALLVCTRTPGPRLRLLVRDIIPVPHAVCASRQRDAITWPGEYLEAAIDRAESEGLAIVLIHSHPGGLFAFSDADDQSDQRVLPCLFQACGDLHGAAIMTPDGAIRARLIERICGRRPVELVTVSGHDISYWWERIAGLTGASTRPIAFTSMMTEELGAADRGRDRRLGHGLGRGGAGRSLGLRPCVPDRFRQGRAPQSQSDLERDLTDADERRLKVEMFADAIASHRGAGVAEPVAASVLTREAVLAASQCDVLFCCVDTLEARQVADLVAGCISDSVVRRRRNHSCPKGRRGRSDRRRVRSRSTMCSRAGQRSAIAASIPRRVSGRSICARSAPDAHRQELEAGYIKGLIEEAPSVITLNMRAAAACVNEFIARAYPFRIEPNNLYARTTFSLAACEEEFTAEESFRRFAESRIWAAARLSRSSACQPCGRRVRKRRHEADALVPQELGAHCAAAVICASSKAIACRPVCRGAISCSREMATRTGASECAAPAVAGERSSCW